MALVSSKRKMGLGGLRFLITPITLLLAWLVSPTVNFVKLFSTVARMRCVGIWLGSTAKFNPIWSTSVWASLNFVVDKFTTNFFG